LKYKHKKDTKINTMKTKHYLIIGVLSLSIAGLIFTGCKKGTTSTSTDTTAAQDDANAAFAVQDSKNISDGAAKGQAQERLQSACENISRRDTMNHGDSLVDIFFGNSDCTCLDGRKRRGHIIVYWPVANHYIDSGANIGMTFYNYAVNDIGVSGTRTLTNTGKNLQGSQSWSFNANLTLTYPNGGGTATWTSQRTNVLTQNNNIWYFSITGTASGTSRKGSTYTINITSPLYFQVPYQLIHTNPNPSCSYIESGQLTINVSSFSYPIYVSFGVALGQCSSDATATINGVPFNFSQQ
jgi:hypothetical protein